MRKSKKVLLLPIFMAFLALAALLISGCPPARKPVPPPPPAPAPKQPAPDRRPAPAPSTERARDAADDIADKAEAVPGVERSYVVVVGNTALIGIDLDKDIQERTANAVKNRVTKRAEQDPRIVEALVSADADTVSRIREIEDGIAKGRPVSEFIDEIGEIITRLTPNRR